MTDYAKCRVLVTGATGYIGSRLVPELLERGFTVRVLTRNRSKVASRAWVDRVEIVEGDATSNDALDRACNGVDIAYDGARRNSPGALIEFPHPGRVSL